MKNPARENEPASPANKPSSTPKPAPEAKLAAEAPPAKDITRAQSTDATPQGPKTSEGKPAEVKPAETGDQDPKAISESLRRIRTSGPLIIEAIKQNQDRQNQDRVNEIIALSVQGMGESKESRREEPKGPPPPPPAPPLQKARKGGKQANTGRQAQSQRPRSGGLLSGAPTGSKPLPPRQNTQAVLQSTTQSLVQTAKQTAAQTAAAAAAMKQSVARKTTGFLSGSSVKGTAAGSNSGQLAPSGPSTVLVQASGFKPQSGFGSKLRIGLIALAVLLAAGTYFMFRDKLLIQAHPSENVSNLVSPEDQSAQLIKQGETDRAQGRYETAMDHFQHALDLAPNNADVRYMLGQTYLVAGQTDEAMKAFQDILRIAPEHLDARLQIAEIYRARGNWGAAYKEYQNIIDLNQSSPQAAAALEAIEKQQSGAPATQEVAKNAPQRRVRQIRPIAPALPSDTVGFQIPLAPQRLTAAPGINPPATLNSARTEERPDPRSVADLHKKLGVRYLNIREFRAAINEFLQALSLTPEDKDLYYFIGSSYHGLGQFAEAYDYYRRVDGGPYVGPAQSGTKQTEKAAREASKRREVLKFQTIKDEQKPDAETNNTNKSAKSFMNRILDSFR